MAPEGISSLLATVRWVPVSLPGFREGSSFATSVLRSTLRFRFASLKVCDSFSFDHRCQGASFAHIAMSVGASPSSAYALDHRSDGFLKYLLGLGIFRKTRGLSSP